MEEGGGHVVAGHRAARGLRGGLAAFVSARERRRGGDRASAVRGGGAGGASEGGAALCTRRGSGGADPGPAGCVRPRWCPGEPRGPGADGGGRSTGATMGSGSGRAETGAALGPHGPLRGWDHTGFVRTCEKLVLFF